MLQGVDVGDVGWRRAEPCGAGAAGCAKQKLLFGQRSPLLSVQTRKQSFIAIFTKFLAMKKICILAPAYPYRGGIASFTHALAESLQKEGMEVDIITFSLQYPSFLFPGKTQYSDSPYPKGLKIERKINSINPLNWICLGRKIRKSGYDCLVVKYWTPFLAPALGSISRLAKQKYKGKKLKVCSVLHNVVPHELHFYDKPLSRYFVGSMDSFLYMSKEVGKDLEAFGSNFSTAMAPHPVYSNFGEAVSKEEACQKLGLDPNIDYILSFGLIRDYKGLDLLFEAYKILKDKGLTNGKKLLIAGEFYSNKEKYLNLIKSLGLEFEKDIILHDFFVLDEDVKYYFSASSMVVQPYKTATQSGVTQIAYKMGTPMIVTNVGGLAEIVPDGKVGFVCKVQPEDIADAMQKLFCEETQQKCKAGIEVEKERFSWEYFCKQLKSVM